MVKSKTYRLSPRRSVVVHCLVAFFIGLPLLLAISGIVAGDDALINSAAIIGCIMLPFAGFLLFCIHYPRLVLTVDGLTLMGVGLFSTLFVPWSNVQRLRLIPGSEGLILNKPLTTSVTTQLIKWSDMSYRGTSCYDDEQRRLIAEARYVPLEAYAAWFERGDLLVSMRDFAPTLVDNFRERRRAAEESQIADRQKVIIVALVTALFSLIVVAGALIAS